MTSEQKEKHRQEREEQWRRRLARAERCIIYRGSMRNIIEVVYPINGKDVLMGTQPSLERAVKLVEILDEAIGR